MPSRNSQSLLMQPNLDQRLNTNRLLHSRLTDLLRKMHTKQWGPRIDQNEPPWQEQQATSHHDRPALSQDRAREIQLILPAELKACLGKRIIMYLSTQMSLRQISSMSGDL